LYEYEKNTANDHNLENPQQEISDFIA